MNRNTPASISTEMEPISSHDDKAQAVSWGNKVFQHIPTFDYPPLDIDSIKKKMVAEYNLNGESLVRKWTEQGIQSLLERGYIEEFKCGKFRQKKGAVINYPR